ncbi:hypothetical protein AX17_003410 [Amanita inopinata Kibby_2008]|nr:hypothetical protein AX17_003410 [Amanita inopinata Kibby_2008]
MPSQIPALSPDFFSSPFWTWFCIQRPILDPNEFSQRYIAHIKGTHTLGHEGGILAMLLVLWAASFGVDEFGAVISDDRDRGEAFRATDPASTSPSNRNSRRAGSALFSVNAKNTEKPGECTRRHPEKIDTMLCEILELIDFHGIMRRPSWDGVRVLLLVLPLMEETPRLERTAMHEAALSQARALCGPLTAGPGTSSPLPPFAAEGSILRTRIYLYAHIQESTSTGIKGGHLVFHQDDLEAFQTTSRPSPPSMALAFAPDTVTDERLTNGQASTYYTLLDPQLVHLTNIPLRLSAVCRKVHEVLTGLKAVRRAEEHNLIDANGMREIWQELDKCWHDFNAMKSNVVDSGMVNIDCFADAWLIFVFECHNIISESLKHSMFAVEPSDSVGQPLYLHPASRPSSHSSSSSPYLPPRQLYFEARAKCIRLLPCILHIIRYHLSKKDKFNSDLNLFAWDTGLIRDGCFFAGLIAASMHGDIDVSDNYEYKHEESKGRLTAEEGVNICLAALAEMHWAFSKSEERSKTIRLAWENNKEREGQMQEKLHPESTSVHRASDYRALDSFPDRKLHASYTENPVRQYSQVVNINAMPGVDERSPLPPLNLTRSPRQIESAPSTACSIDGTGTNGWPTYTPPTTATSRTSTGGSSTFHGVTGADSYKSGHDDTVFYHVPDALDHFAYTVAAPQTTTSIVAPPLYQPRNAFTDTHVIQPPVGAAPNYFNPGLFASSNSSVMEQATTDVNGYAEEYYS